MSASLDAKSPIVTALRIIVNPPYDRRGLFRSRLDLRILVVGAGGFVGRHIVAELLAAGHVPVGAVRRVSDFANAFPGVAAVSVDLVRDLTPADWLPRLKDIDGVVNAVGVLSGADMEAVHV